MVGAVWILYINADYFSVAVSVGLIALVWVAIETAGIMLQYLSPPMMSSTSPDASQPGNSGDIFRDPILQVAGDRQI